MKLRRPANARMRRMPEYMDGVLHHHVFNERQTRRTATTGLPLVHQHLDDTDASVIAAEVHWTMVALGQCITTPGDVLELEETEVRRTVLAILERWLPVWWQLKIL